MLRKALILIAMLATPAIGHAEAKTPLGDVPTLAEINQQEREVEHAVAVALITALAAPSSNAQVMATAHVAEERRKLKAMRLKASTAIVATK